MGNAALNKDKGTLLLKDVSKLLIWEGLKIFNASQHNLVAESSSPFSPQKIKGLIFVVMPGNGGAGKKASGLMIHSVSHRASQGSGYSFLKYPTRSFSILTALDL